MLCTAKLGGPSHNLGGRLTLGSLACTIWRGLCPPPAPLVKRRSSGSQSRRQTVYQSFPIIGDTGALWRVSSPAACALKRSRAIVNSLQTVDCERWPPRWPIRAGCCVCVWRTVQSVVDDVTHLTPCPTDTRWSLRLVPAVRRRGKGKVFPYSSPSIRPGADPGVQAVSPQVTWSESRHRPGSRLPLLSARPAFTFVAFTRWRYL